MWRARCDITSQVSGHQEVISPEVTTPDVRSACKWHHYKLLYISGVQNINCVICLPSAGSELPDSSFDFCVFFVSFSVFSLSSSFPFHSGSAGLCSWSPLSLWQFAIENTEISFSLWKEYLSSSRVISNKLFISYKGINHDFIMNLYVTTITN